MSGASLTLDRVALDRGGRRLIEGLSLAVGAGEAVELRGPNGAGKSSLLRALAGLLPFAAGMVRLEPQAEDDDTRPVAYLGHLDAIKAGETVAGQLGFWQALASVPGVPVTDALGRLGLGRLGHLPGAMLSAGQRRRLALARLLVAPRPIWLLDEPAAPLDAAGRGLLAGLLEEHRVNGGLVIAAVHDPLPGGASQTLTLEPAP